MKSVQQKIKNKTILVVLLGMSLLFAACPKRPPEKPPKEPYRRPPVLQPEMEEGPEAQAAQELIRKGQKALNEEDAERAEDYFQEALRLAPSYGPAYYWAARAKYDLGAFSEAWDLLDKAELLIGHEPEWLERIEQLKAAVSDAGA